ncbi:hypothetical protein [Rhizobium lusitanum]|uniref:hypothetical protein n=1 Tax=Rhizobium lusitanum TaxID=293958 RepID=UPI00195C0EEC|nr:hypothetical protein [Rhizobium lusitanum]MBM7046221.1 hypothetical protein [Rhizobium lusitanum]
MDAVTAAVEGQGVLLGWKAIIEKHLQIGALVPMSIEEMPSSGAHYVVIRKGRPEASHVTRFKRWVVAACERYRGDGLEVIPNGNKFVRNHYFLPQSV